MIAQLPWDLAPHLPWRHFTSWSHQWSVLPSFLVGEYLFIGLAALALLHARACGRDHVLTWVAGLVAGTANDLFFMALPLVDNFWQAQATIMITPRLAQVGLSFGADDIDGTVTEEKIAHDAGADTPQVMTVHELVRLVREAGRRPVERDTVFNVVKEW